MLSTLALAIVITSFTSTAAYAVGHYVWTIRLHKHYPFLTPADYDYYGTQTYTSKAAAIAAVKQLDPANDSSGEPIIQESGIDSMTPGSVTYKLTAPHVDTPFTNWAYLSFRNNSFPDEASAVADSDFGVCNSTAYGSKWVYTAAGSWTPDPGSYPPPNDVLDSKPFNYTQTYWDTSLTPPGCTTTTGTSIMHRSRGEACPTGYYVHQNPSGTADDCNDPYTGYVTGYLLECPKSGAVSTKVGDPCDVATGDFSQTESDFKNSTLSFVRNYHSAVLETTHALGVGWTHNYAATLVLDASSGLPSGMLRPDGHHDAISTINGAYVTLSGAGIHVAQNGSEWDALLSDGSKEIYDLTGRLIRLITAGGVVTTLGYNSLGQLTTIGDPFGHTMLLSYNTAGQIQQLTDPSGHNISYAYDTHNNLTSATLQDGTSRTYLYENANWPNNLTGILDESNTRFVTVTYDATSGAVTSSAQAGGAQAVSIAYNASSAVVTDALGAVNTYTFTTESGVTPRVLSLQRNALTQSFAVPTSASDPQRRVTQRTDANGSVTNLSYDNNHLTAKTEAYGTGRARTTSYTYLGTNTALPTLVTGALRSTSYSYFSGTNLLQSKTVTDTASGVSRSGLTHMIVTVGPSRRKGLGQT